MQGLPPEIADISRQWAAETAIRSARHHQIENWSGLHPQELWPLIPLLIFSGKIDQSQLCHMPYSSFLKTKYWKAVAFQVKSLHPYCQQCGEHLEQLHVHHRTYIRRGLEWKNLSDLVVLCHTCHLSAHGRKSRKS